MDVSDWLRERVYPNLDLHKSGLLDDYAPKHKGAVINFDCPNCGAAGKAYHYIGSGWLQCSHRGEKCGYKSSIYGFLVETCNVSKQQAVVDLASAAGVEEPNPNSGSRNEDGSPELWEIRKSAKLVFKQLLLKTPRAMNYLTQVRKIPVESLRELELGYYPDAKTVAEALKKANVPIKVAIEWGLLPKGPKSVDRFRDRIVGFWMQPDDTFRLWGRAIEKPNNAPADWRKYEYTPGMVKDLPYLLESSPTKSMLAIEGPFDAIALKVMGVPACATGGNCLTRGQSRSLLKKGCKSITYLVDEGVAGRTGALTTIRYAEPNGIHTHFAVVPEGQDDVDSMRRNGKEEQVHWLISKAISGGEFIARTYERAAATLTAESRTHELEVALSLRDVLTSESKMDFTRFMSAEVGMSPSKLRDALQTLANLVDVIDDVDEACALIKRRYQYQITIERVNG